MTDSVQNNGVHTLSNDDHDGYKRIFKTKCDNISKISPTTWHCVLYIRGV